MPTNDNPLKPHDPHVRDSESPGYETTDVNVNGVVVFLAGLFGFLIVFFVFCFVMGRVINNALQKADGPTTKRNTHSTLAGAATTEGKPHDLPSHPDTQHTQPTQLPAPSPPPRRDLHARNPAT